LNKRQETKPFSKRQETKPFSFGFFNLYLLNPCLDLGLFNWMTPICQWREVPHDYACKQVENLLYDNIATADGEEIATRKERAIKEVRKRFGNDKLAKAVCNFEAFYGLERGAANIDMVVESSTGVSGWASCTTVRKKVSDSPRPLEAKRKEHLVSDFHKLPAQMGQCGIEAKYHIKMDIGHNNKMDEVIAGSANDTESDASWAFLSDGVVNEAKANRATPGGDPCQEITTTASFKGDDEWSEVSSATLNDSL
jgi:hypothetical protein